MSEYDRLKAQVDQIKADQLAKVIRSPEAEAYWRERIAEELERERIAEELETEAERLFGLRYTSAGGVPYSVIDEEARRNARTARRLYHAAAFVRGNKTQEG